MQIDVLGRDAADDAVVLKLAVGAGVSRCGGGVVVVVVGGGSRGRGVGGVVVGGHVDFADFEAGKGGREAFAEGAVGCGGEGVVAW